MEAHGSRRLMAHGGSWLMEVITMALMAHGSRLMEALNSWRLMARGRSWLIESHGHSCLTEATAAALIAPCAP